MLFDSTKSSIPVPPVFEREKELGTRTRDQSAFTMKTTPPPGSEETLCRGMELRRDAADPSDQPSSFATNNPKFCMYTNRIVEEL
jgi:hypothetical protein